MRILLLNKQIAGNYYLENLPLFYRNKELLGQMIKNEKDVTEQLNPAKISHVVKNINYNNITESVYGEIECLSTPYGKYLQLLLDKTPNNIKFYPKMIYDNKNTIIRILRVDAVVKDMNE